MGPSEQNTTAVARKRTVVVDREDDMLTAPLYKGPSRHSEETARK